MPLFPSLSFLPFLSVTTRLNTTVINQQSYLVGQRFSLPCDSSPFSGPVTRTWTQFNNTDLSPLTVIDTRGSLVVVMATLNNAGVYECELQTEMGVANILYNVTIVGMCIHVYVHVIFLYCTV